ncbi:hypothetical protein RJ639_044577, partial [Escallonia herrerae]
MPSLRNALTTSPTSSSSSPSDSPLNSRRLTRQRKLRHVSGEELGLKPGNDRSKSLPASPGSGLDSGSRSPGHWSMSAVPQPLPLPELHSPLKRNDYLALRREGTNVGHYNFCVCARLDPARPVQEQTVRQAQIYLLHQTTWKTTDQVATKSLRSPTYLRRGFHQNLNVESADRNFRVNVPARSAPTSGFTSPSLSPPRFGTANLFNSLSTLDASVFNRLPGSASQVLPLRLTPSPNHSPLRSPTLLSPCRARSPTGVPLQSQHKSLPESSVARSEGNNANVHPLPLPPGVSRSSQSNAICHGMDKSDVSPIKGQWQKGKLIGHGTYGRVYVAINRNTGASCAMKEVDIIPDDSKSTECIKQLEQEIKVLQNLEHPNIVQYYGSEVVEDRFCIYLEYVHPGSINNYVREHCKAVTECVVRNFTRHIVSGLAYLHSTKTVHRDIKGANLLVDASGVVKLADFGLAKHLTGLSTDFSLKGSPHWMAPEVLQAVMRRDADSEHAFAVDIWSLGCTVIEMLTGKPPWGEISGVQAMFSVLNKSPPIPETLSSEGKDFLRGCFQRNPADRPTAVMLLGHPFLWNSHGHNISLGMQEFSAMKLNFPTPYYSRIQHRALETGLNIRIYCHLYQAHGASMENCHMANGKIMEVSESLTDKIYSGYSGGLHFATPASSLRTDEVELVQGVLQALQGSSSSVFYWNDIGQTYCAKPGIYVAHLSRKSLHAILDQFIYAATCLQLVDVVVNKVKVSVRSPPPTLRAFSCSISAWLRRLRDIALKEEVKISNYSCGTAPTLLGLASSLSSLCSGAEYLLQIVHGAIPQVYLDPDPPLSAADIAVHILNYLYKKLNEVCLVHGGEEDAYRMVLHTFVGCLLPLIEGLDSWLFEGTLDDPFEELFFYANKEIGIDESEFWEKSYLFRPNHDKEMDMAHELPALGDGKKDVTRRESISVPISAKGKEQTERDLRTCPLFIKDLAKAIMSAGKSLQLIRHDPMTSSAVSGSEQEIGQSITKLTLSEVFCVSLTALVGHGDHVSDYLWHDDKIVSSLEYLVGKHDKEGHDESLPSLTYSEKVWPKFLFDTLSSKREISLTSVRKDANDFVDAKGESLAAGDLDDYPLTRSCCPENPAVTVSSRFLDENRGARNTLKLSRSFHLPPLNDDALRKAIFGGNSRPLSAAEGTNFTFGFQFRESDYLRSQEETNMLEALFPFPTLLPPFQDDLRMSEVLPFQNNSTLPSRVLSWMESVEPNCTPHPLVDTIGGRILSKLLYEWRLMDELGVLRAIYLLGSGDLLQHFLTVIFSKLDKGVSWDDDFELNTVLQESIRNSADGILLSTPDSLVVSITKSPGSNGDEQHDTSIHISTPRKSRAHSSGINGLESLKFTYKVPWPLELIANTEAIKKYNQVMSFLLKVKRAKFALDQARRWMWKDRGTATVNRKHHWLVEQKLLHFVDAFHQYVMDRVYHSAWRELCEGMAAAGSLDEVIEVHEAYLLSIQRQCFVVPDKLWALIASRINNILELALDFYSIQQTLSSGGAVSAIKARCEMEVDRIERQFDDCISFLLRVLSFKLNVGQFPHLADL